MNIGRMISGFLGSIFGGNGGGNIDATPPVVPGAPMPVADTTHNGVTVPGGFTPATPETIGSGLIQAARSDASLQAFLASMTAATHNTDKAVLNSSVNEGATIQFGYMQTVHAVDSSGHPYSYTQLNSFGTVQSNSYTHTVQDTSGGIHFDGNTSWNGYFDQARYVPGQDVTVVNDTNNSTHDQVTLVGVGNPMPNIFVDDTNYGGGKG